MTSYEAVGHEEASLKPEIRQKRQIGTATHEQSLKWIVVTLCFTLCAIGIYALVFCGSNLRIPLIISVVLAAVTSLLLVVRQQPKKIWFKVLMIIFWAAVCGYLSYCIAQANERNPGSITKRWLPVAEVHPTVTDVHIPSTGSKGGSRESTSTESGTKGSTKESAKTALDTADKLKWSIIACAVIDGVVMWVVLIAERSVFRFS